MSYSNGTPAPGSVVEFADSLYLVVGLDPDTGHLLGTDVCDVGAPGVTIIEDLEADYLLEAFAPYRVVS